LRLIPLINRRRRSRAGSEQIADASVFVSPGKGFLRRKSVRRVAGRTVGRRRTALPARLLLFFCPVSLLAAAKSVNFANPAKKGAGDVYGLTASANMFQSRQRDENEQAILCPAGRR